MPDREYIYQFKMDAAQARREAAQVARVFQTAFREIELKPRINVPNLKNVSQQIQSQLNQAQATAQRGRSAAANDPYKAQLESAKLLAAEIKDREREEKANLAILNQQTSELRMQEALLQKREISLRRQARDARAATLGMNPSAFASIRGSRVSPAMSPSAGGGMGGGIGAGGELIPGFGQLMAIGGYTIAGMAISELGRRAIDTTIALTEQGTALRRGDFAAMKLAGSTERLNNLMKIYQRITGDAQTTGEATSTLGSLIALGNADSEAELRRFMTASIGSSRGTGRTMDYIMQELQLTIANKSERRLDQLGLSIDEVRKQEEALHGVNEEARFGEAVITALINKYGELVTSAEAGASGLELFGAQLRQVREEAARNVEQRLNPVFNQWATVMGSQNVNAQAQQLQWMAGMTSKQIGPMTGPKADDMWAYNRLATLLQEVDAAARNGGQGMEELQGRVQSLATEVIRSGQITEEQSNQLHDLEVNFRVAASGGIVYADALTEADRAAAAMAETQAKLNAQYSQALRLMADGQMYVNMPIGGFTPVQGPNLPSEDYLRQRGITGGGGFLTPGGNSVADIMANAREQGLQREQQLYEESVREKERAEKEAISTAEQGWKSAASATERAFRDAATELENQIRKIPGLFGSSEVTPEQLNLAEMGVPQNFADNMRRRLEDEVLNKVDWADIDPAAMFARAGIDPNLDPKAQLALFNQKWADQSLFADPDNLSFFDQDAIRAEMERQRQSKLGQQNIMGMFGLGEDDEGTVFKDLGSFIAGGFKAGAQEGLAEFGEDAIANATMQLKSDAAIQEYVSTGEILGGALYEGVVKGMIGGDLVSAVTAEVLRSIADSLPAQ